MRPVCRRLYVAVLYRIKVNVLDVTPIIHFVPHHMFPITMLPKGVLAFGRFCILGLQIYFDPPSSILDLRSYPSAIISPNLSQNSPIAPW